MIHGCNFGPHSEEFRDFDRALFMLLHSHRQCSQATQQEPRIEWMENSAEQQIGAIEDSLESFCCRDHRASYNITMAADVLRRRMNDDIDAVVDRFLE